MRGIFHRSFGNFLLRERANIVNGVSERNLCGRLALYIEEERQGVGLQGYYADPEYNRMQDGRIKTILDERYEEVSITCDLILHSRGEIVGRDNLIAIEMKKSDRPNHEKVKDRVRLRALTKASYDDVWSADGVTLPEFVCGYELGVYIELDVQRRQVLVEEFEHGVAVRSKVCLLSATRQPDV